MSSHPAAAEFHSTRWSLVFQAHVDEPAGRLALQQLCETYWFPVYAFFRRRGFQAEDAQDLAQDLFTGILSRRGFAGATPAKGRFRSFLLAAAQNLIAEQHRNRRTKKRGGDVKTWSIDWATAEERLNWEPQEGLTAERIFEIRWARQILADTLRKLDELNSDPARQEYYLRLRSFIAYDSRQVPYSQLAAELQVSESALRVQVHRLRAKFRQLLRQIVADTLSDPSLVDEELDHLQQCLS